LRGGRRNVKSIGVRMRVHPSYFLGLIVAVAMGQGLNFLALTLCALLHEYGHYVSAEKRGYTLNRILLTPFGAAVGGNNQEISAKDELAVFFAGPLVNFYFCVGTVATWWLFPDLYPYTETVFWANASLCLCNLLPVFPLDGGRILYALLKRKFTPKMANRLTGGAGLFTLFGYTALAVKGGAHIAFVLVFWLITLPFLFRANHGEGYYKCLTHRTASRRNKGMHLSLLAFSVDSTLSTAIKRMRAGESYILYLYQGDIPVKTLSETQVYRLAEQKSLYLTFWEALGAET